MAAMGYGTPLGQLGQGWWHQAGGSAQYGDQGIPGAMGGGVGQTGNWMQDTGPMAGDAGAPGAPGSPAATWQGVSATAPFMQNNAVTSSQPAAQSPGITAPGAPASGAPSQALARAPASGPPLGYGQPSFMMGRSFNPGGFGGIGTRGQGSGAPFWARLNNIGGR